MERNTKNNFAYVNSIMYRGLLIIEDQCVEYNKQDAEQNINQHDLHPTQSKINK